MSELGEKSLKVNPFRFSESKWIQAGQVQGMSVVQDAPRVTVVVPGRLGRSVIEGISLPQILSFSLSARLYRAHTTRLNGAR